MLSMLTSVNDTALSVPRRPRRGHEVTGPSLKIDRAQLRVGNPALFTAGNQIAAKPKWSDERVRKFQKKLIGFREWLGYSHDELGKELRYSGAYIRMLEGTFASAPLRQPSSKFLKALAAAEATAKPKKKFRASQHLGRRTGELWSHVLVRKFKCPECAREVRRGERAPGLEWWWHPTRRHCPEHDHRTSRGSKRSRKLSQR